MRSTALRTEGDEVILRQRCTPPLYWLRWKLWTTVPLNWAWVISTIRSELRSTQTGYSRVGLRWRLPNLFD